MNIRTLLFSSLGLVWVLLAGPATRATEPDAKALEFFEQKVRPVLVEHCYSCHSEKAKKLKGGLLLDSQAGWENGGTSGKAALVRGKPDESLLVKSVRHEGDHAMPPGKKLSAAAIADLTAWVTMGAPDSRTGAKIEARPADSSWWSLLPIRKPKLPIANEPNPVDAFVFATLNQNGMKPSPEADRRTRIRRLTFDLHGLPPTPEEIDAYVADAAANADAKLIDRLLASPRYGERWGRHWLDVVPYADTHGYDKDKRRDRAWPYRDYVIGAFNDDTPYSQFVKEQLAGDVLYPNVPRATAATGFIAAGPWDFVGHMELREGTIEKAKTRLIDRDDMVANSFSTFQSLTVHCARCHDHKFDPIPQRDYYRLQAVFAGVERGNRAVPNLAGTETMSKLQTKREAVLAQQREIEAKIVRIDSAKLRELDASLPRTRAAFALLKAPSGTPGSPSNGWHSKIHPTPDAIAWVQVDLGAKQPVTCVKLHPARPTDFADTPGFGFPVRFKISISTDAKFEQSETVFESSDEDFRNPKDEPLAIALDGREVRFVRVTATKLWKRSADYVFALSELEVESGGKNLARAALVTSSESIEAGRWGMRHLVDGHSSRAAIRERTDPEFGAAIRERDAVAIELRTLEFQRQRELESRIDASTRKAREEARSSLAEIDRQLAAQPEREMVYAAVPQATARPIHILKRGEVQKPMEAVSPGGLSCIAALAADFPLAPTEPEGKRRAALAEWIAHRDNPLTWRSMANRVWHYHFGKGLVDTPNDFGRNGSKPSHPELLDFLAAELREHQSIKQLHRLIVSSKTYRQTSSDHPAYAKIDSENRYLWRANRSRLDAESIRDSILAISGKLDLKMGGPGFELFRFQDDHSPIYDHTDATKSNRPEAWRRTVYRFAVRSVPNPFLDCLDCADPNANTPKRNQTLTALQALALLNDPFAVHQAGYFAERLRAISPERPRQIDALFRLALGRLPTDAERTAVQEFIADNGLPAACRLVWNLNEFAFVD